MNEGRYEVSDAPVVAGFIHGLRVWHVSSWAGGFRLSSAAARFRWDPDNPGAAVCRRGPDPHPVPSTDCSCGFYSFHQSREAMGKVVMHAKRSQQVAIAGIVRSWGRTEVHADGMRSEYAKPDVLFMPRDASFATHTLIHELAGMYGAAVWEGSPQYLLDRMKDHKPGLSKELTPQVTEGLPEASSRRKLTAGGSAKGTTARGGPASPPRKDRLVRITPKMSRESIDPTRKRPLKPEGYWLAGSNPTFVSGHNPTNSGNRLIRLRGIRRGFHWRHCQPFPPPGSRVRLELNLKEKTVDLVTCGSGLLIGKIPSKVARQILRDDPFLAATDAWILCGWRHPERSPGSHPEAFTILVGRPGIERPRFLHPHSGDDEGS